ncbi:MAG: hypothetical protein AB7D05_05430 [Mangrovibacterium sp.]
MDRQIFLAWTSGSQWILFLGIMLIIFARTEKRKRLEQAGQLLFFLTGLASLGLLLSGQLGVPTVLPGRETPTEAGAMIYFTGLCAMSVPALTALLLGTKKPNRTWLLNLILIFAALVLFFMVYRLQQLS